MEFIKIENALPKEFPFRLMRYRDVIYDAPILHKHDFLELNLICGGKGVNIIGDREYELNPGDIYIINNNEYHHAFDYGSLEILVFIFDPVFIWANNAFDYDYLRPFFERKVYFYNKIDGNSKLAEELGSVMVEIEAEYNEEQEGYRLPIKSQLMKILSLLYRHMKTSGFMDSVYDYEHKKDYERIKDAVLYINSHYTDDIDMEELSAMVYMNIPNFSSLFKKVMKMTVTEYLTILRINCAARLLKETTVNITDICSQSGFKSIPHFNRVFKQIMNVTPSEYRKNA